MKNVTFTFFLGTILSINSIVFAQEVWLETEPDIIQSLHEVRSLKIAPDSSIWAVSDSTNYTGSENLTPYVYISTDFGKTWSKKAIPVPTHVLDISPVNKNVAYITSRSGLHKTADRGDTWDKLETGTHAGHIIHFFNENDAFGIFWNAAALEPPYTDAYWVTSDGGTSWTKMGDTLWAQPEGTSLPEQIAGEWASNNFSFSSTYDVKGDTIAFGQSTGYLWLSKDKGYNWERIETPLVGRNTQLTTVALKDTRTIVVASYINQNGFTSPLVFQTRDGGISWQPATPLLTPASIEYLPGSDSIFVMGGHDNPGGFGQKGTALSLDYGSTWQLFNHCKISSISAMVFTSDSMGIACSDNNIAEGQFNSWNINAHSVIDYVENPPECASDIEVSFSEDQIVLYPNPAGENIHINLKNKFLQDEVRFDFISLSGKVVASYTFIYTGTLCIPVQEWPTGLYLLRITGTDKTEVKKFMKK